VGNSREDEVDRHIARWMSQIQDMDPQVEGAITRMQDVLRRLKRSDAAAYAGSRFSQEDYKTLHALMVQPYPVEATPAQLAETCHVTRAAMTSRLDRLAGAGFVTREVDPVDRRRVIVRATSSGRARWTELVSKGMAREQQLLHVLSEQEKTQLNALLRKVLLSLED
jgi:DNA-binding MarR family transcriptional regulator